MAFDFSTLVTDRTQQDVAYARQLAEKLVAGTATEEEKAEWNSFTLKGVYNHTDLNRVTTALEVLKAKLESYGYLVPGYEKVKITHPTFSGGSNLPDGYIELEYIQSTGTQYINTGVVPTGKTMVDISFVPSVDGQQDNAMFGASWSNNGFLLTAYRGNVRFHSKGYYQDFAKKDGVMNVMSCSSTSVTINGQTYAMTGTGSDTQAYPIYLFWVGDESSPNNKGHYRLYSCSLYDEDLLVRDFVPCISPAGDVGLFDTVNQQFYVNAGTGVFTAGNRMGVTLPSGYTRLSHIESTGSQYVNTGINATVGTKAIVNFQATSTPTTNWWILSAVTSGTVLFRAGVNASTFRTDAGFTYSQTASLTARTTANGICTVNMSIPLYLFAQNEGGAVEFGKFKLYSCLLYNNGVLVRDYIPCLNDSGVAGLYDLVSESFFGSNGTESFVAGAIPRELPEGYTQVEYIQSSGTQYIDTEFKPNQDTKVVMDVESEITTAHALFSARTSATSKAFEVIWSSYDCYRFYYNNGYVEIDSISVSPTTRRTIVVDKNAIIIDGTSTTRTYATFQAECNMVLFARNTVGTIGAYTTGKLYSCQVFDNGTLVRDYVPCKNPSGVVGLYDLVNGVFYQNAGSGAFTVGEEIVAPATASVMVISGNADGYDPYTWYEFDCPTPETMTTYLLNVAIIRAILAVRASTPNVPDDMVELMVKEANDIEVILLDVYKQINIMATTFIPCGEALCGGDNL